jgi:hypothetical protein
MKLNHLIIGIVIVLANSTTFADAESGTNTIELACEITCGALKGVQKLAQESEDADEPLAIKGTWENHLFVIEPEMYETVAALCELAAPYVAAKSFHDDFDILSLDLTQCETRPVTFGWLGLRTYDVMPQGYDRDEL